MPAFTTPFRVLSLAPLASLALAAACATSASAPAESSERSSNALTSTASVVVPGVVRPPPPGRAMRAPATAPPAVSYPPTNGCASPLEYFGGAIIAKPAVVQVSWNDPGTTGTVPSSVEGYLHSWWPAIVSPQAGYLAWLTEYNTVGHNGKDGLAGSGQTFAGSGTYAGLFKITPAAANQTAAVTDTQIQAELVAQIGAGHLPAPTFDATGRCNTIYFPPSVTDISFTFAGTAQHSCTDFCGYHGATTYAGKHVYYGVHPDLSSACTACAPDGLQQDVAMVHSHELAEAMTDAEISFEALTATATDFLRPGGWDQIASGCSEIGDSCAWPTTGIPTVTYNGQAFYVQGLFDNARMDCETAAPAAACTTNAQCTGTTPICDPTSHSCRACVTTDCTGATPICDGTTGACRACVAADCKGATPVCDTAIGQCVQCDATDHSACVAPKSICDATLHTCRGCLSNADCATSTNHVCDAATGACVACMSNSDCASQACDTATHVCVQCTADSECSNPTPVCNTAGSPADTCRACKSDAECAANTHGHACSTTGSCVQCTAGNTAACPPGSTCDTATETCVAAGSDAGAGHDGGSGHDGGTGAQDGGSASDASVQHDGGHGDGGSSSGSSSSGSSSSGGSSSGGSSSGGGDSDAATGGGSGGGGGCSVSTNGEPPSLPAVLGLLVGLAIATRRRSARGSAGEVAR